LSSLVRTGQLEWHFCLPMPFSNRLRMRPVVRTYCVQCSFSCDLLGRLDVHTTSRPVKEFLADFLKLFQYLHSCNIWPNG